MEEAKIYEARAVQKYLRISPRKVRLVVDTVRGDTVESALSKLAFTNKKAASYVAKVIKSAAANLRDRFEDESFEDEELIIKHITADEGPVLKRIQPAPMGRAHPIRKRTSHVTVVIEKPEAETEPDETETELETE